MSERPAVAEKVPSMVARARAAVLVSFLVSGLLQATFASRLVLVRESLGIGPGQMGLLLLVVTVGSVVTMPFMGRLVERFGEVLLVRAFSVLAWCALVANAFFAGRGMVSAMIAPLFLQGVGVGAWDVAMNLSGARVEQKLGRAIMPQFHAAFSLATLVATGAGWVFARAGAPLLAHVGIVAVVGLVAVQGFAAWLLPPAAKAVAVPGVEAGSVSSVGTAAREATPEGASAAKGRSAWLEPRTLLIGVVMLSMSLTEGGANDWIASAVVQGFGTAETEGIACLAVFLAAMTATRVLGTRLIDRWGRVRALRACVLCAFVGLACFGLAPWLWLAVVGVAVWGMGSALGFPMGISAASDDPVHAARRTSVVSTIGYLAFLGGPPLLGLLAAHVGFRHALLVILIPVVVSFFLAGWMAPLRQSLSARADGS